MPIICWPATNEMDGMAKEEIMPAAGLTVVLAERLHARDSADTGSGGVATVPRDTRHPGG